MSSIWRREVFAGATLKTERKLKDVKADVVVIGGGMAGILTAHLLQQQGVNPIVIEANKVGSGQTENTTAKITALHGLKYDKLLNSMGEEITKQYYQANTNAIQQYRSIIEKNNIECDFEEKDNYVYSRKYIENIEKEIKATEVLKIPADFVKDTKLPFPIEGAIRFRNQAQFHPLKFLMSISESLTIFEDTKVISVEENIDSNNKKLKIITEDGDIFTDWCVVATHFPFINTSGFYFARMYQERSYVVAYDGAPDVNGMYIGDTTSDYSFRNYNGHLIIAGGNHRSGEPLPSNSYEIIRKAAKKFYPESIEKYHWSAQDCMTLDSIPYIGSYSSSLENILVATGFEKWGMSSSMVSANILKDRIIGKENEFSEAFSPQRFELSAVSKNLLKNSLEAVKGISKEGLSIPTKEVEDLQKGEAKRILFEGKKIGAFRDDKGKVHFVSTKCTHLGCQLEWNPNELTWDCPCHGSRFTYKGNLLNNPALKDICLDDE